MTINKDRSFEANNGFLVISEEGGNAQEGPFYTGGPSIPIGFNLPKNTLYVQTDDSGFIIWEKYGEGNDDWTVHDDVLRTTDIDYGVKVPLGSVLRTHSRNFNNELWVDGEVYIL